MSMTILSGISTPQDIKSFSVAELETLACEIREFIIANVSETGGHLASSLGTVEITLALHYVFDALHDKIVWDVGHQAYSHKILTGRKEKFSTLRQKGGISPFISPEESPYDAFISGHAGNAVSAASGICEAMSKAKSNNRVIAVIGDGSLSNGLTFEGLNFVGMKQLNLIVVLNDNKMFISKNVGAIAEYLSRIMITKSVRDVREGIKSTLRNIPVYGEDIYKLAKRIEGNLKGVMTEGSLFEEMGYRYLGPIDGHRIDHLVETFENIASIEGPILLHVSTRKGYGYTPALNDPENFHGVGKFHLENGEVKGAGVNRSYTDVFGDTLLDLAKKDPRVVAVCAAMSSGTGLKKFAKAFPDRFFDVGIAESHAVTMAAGMAMYGMRPVVAIYSTFLQRSYDEVIHDVALQNTPVIFAIDRAGLVGADGPTHHGMFDIAFMRNIPNMTLMIPRDQAMLRKMLTYSLKIQGPSAIRYPRGSVVAMPVKTGRFRPGKAEVLKKGTKAVVFCVGPLCYTVLEAVGDNEDVAVVDLVCAKPLDTMAIRDMVQECHGRFAVVEDGCIQGGVGSAVLENLKDLQIPLRYKLLGLPDKFIEHGAVDRLRKDLSLDVDGIGKVIRDII